MPWSLYAKRQRTLFFYQRAKSFLGAAVLLQRHGGGDQFVVLHLLCQGIEILLKATLLMKNFDYFYPRLQKTYGHNLERLVRSTLREFQLHDMRSPLADELAELNKLYSRHWLRYGSLFHDLLIDPNSINIRWVERRMIAALRMIERELRRDVGLRNAGSRLHRLQR